MYKKLLKKRIVLMRVRLKSVFSFIKALINNNVLNLAFAKLKYSILFFFFNVTLKKVSVFNYFKLSKLQM